MVTVASVKFTVKIGVLFFILLTSLGCIKHVNRNPSEQEVINVTTGLDSTNSMRYHRAYYQGRQEALDEIKRGKMTIYEYGEDADYPFNVETGLPAKIIAGCIINDSILGLVEGHNQTIKNYLTSLIKDDEINKATSHLDSTSTFDYRKSYFQGIQEAYNEIKNNKITIYIFGKRTWEEIDKETGLRFKTIAGCIVNDSIVGLTEGYNYIIKKFLKHEIK